MTMPPPARPSPSPPSPVLPVFWYDYVDPASYLVERILGELQEFEVVRRPVEVVPPGRPVVPPEDPGWLEHLAAMTGVAAALGIELAPPPVVPWSRKAHELAFHAREQGCFAPIHRAIFDGYFLDGQDIGRVDVLVELAARAGLDRTASRVVLDVDRFAAAITAERAAAQAAEIHGVPALEWGARRLTGFHGPGEIRTFLSSGPSS
jgi:2-hydroxychromene-2-carboxylate isomerase